tara:strand:- start:212 stop:454 length:243 start_codon:yes stop_codon:yes gene_type:complete
MESLFNAEYKWVWGFAMAAALFPFVRRIIWVTSVRRHIRKGGVENVDAAEQERLKKRASVTSALLCLLFSLAYMQVLFAP